MAHTNNSVENTNVVENDNVVENAAPAVVKNAVKATVNGVYINQFEDQSYKTLSLMLNKPLKVMKEGDDGLYHEVSTQFLSLPVSAALSQINDDVMNYFIAVKGADVDALKTALSGAAIEIDQKLFAAGESADDVANESDHDQWFSFIKSVKVSKMATLVMAKQLGLDLAELKLLLEE